MKNSEIMRVKTAGNNGGTRAKMAGLEWKPPARKLKSGVHTLDLRTQDDEKHGLPDDFAQEESRPVGARNKVKTLQYDLQPDQNQNSGDDLSLFLLRAEPAESLSSTLMRRTASAAPFH